MHKHPLAAALAATALALPAFAPPASAQQASSGRNDANAGSNEANPRHDKQGVPGAKSRSSKTGDADTDKSSMTHGASGQSKTPGASSQSQAADALHSDRMAKQKGSQSDGK